LRSFQKALPELESRGIRVAAVSVDPPEVTRHHAEKQGYTFTFLCDEKLDVLRRYDLVHEGGFRGNDISRPAEFLLDATGTIRWVFLTDNYRKRLAPETVLKAAEELAAK
jgi:peroxiredoxin